MGNLAPVNDDRCHRYVVGLVEFGTRIGRNPYSRRGRSCCGDQALVGLGLNGVVHVLSLGAGNFRLLPQDDARRVMFRRAAVVGSGTL
jgi:hypothetical protein